MLTHSPDAMNTKQTKPPSSSWFITPLLYGLVFLLYALPGTLGRSPWKQDDALGFGLAASMLSGNLDDYAVLNVFGALSYDEGPLSFWLAAGFAKGMQALWYFPNNWLDDILRLSNIFWLALLSWAVWQTTYRLAKRPEFLPSNPFSIAPDPQLTQSLAKRLAHGSVLCLLATLGLLLRSHQLSAELAQLACTSLILLAAVRGLEQPRQAGWLLGIAIAMTLLARGGGQLLTMLLVMATSAATHPGMRFGLAQRLLRASLVFTVVVGAWVTWVHNTPGGDLWLSRWWQWHSEQLLPWVHDRWTPQELWVDLKTSLWFFWPIAPMAGWFVYRQRTAWHEPGLRIPLAMTLGGILGMVILPEGGDSDLMPLIAPLAVLAGLSINNIGQTLQRFIQSFAIACYSLLAALVWLGFVAMAFGVPPRIAKNFAKAAPGFELQWSASILLIALALTLLWIASMMHSCRRASSPSSQHPMLVLSAAGTALIWSLLMTLWLPLIDYSKSYKPVGEAIKEMLIKSFDQHLLKEPLNKSPDARRFGLGWDGGSRKRSDIGASHEVPGEPRPPKPEMDRAEGFVQRFLKQAMHRSKIHDDILANTVTSKWANHAVTTPPPRACLATRQLGLAQRAALQHHGDLPLRLRAFLHQDEADEACQWLLIQSNPRHTPPPSAQLEEHWQLVWSGSRPGDKQERFALYQWRGE